MDNPEPSPDPRNSAEHEAWARYYACRSIDEDLLEAINSESRRKFREWLKSEEAAHEDVDTIHTWALTLETCRDEWRFRNLDHAEHHARLAKILHGLEELYR